MATEESNAARNIGLFIIRLGLGVVFIVFGSGKLDPGKWAGIGGAMGVYGITFAPAFWGFMAMVAELVGGVLLALGLFFRPAAFLMFFTMLTATMTKIQGGESFGGFAHPLNMAIVFLGLLIAGGGSIAVGRKIPGLGNKWFA